jgi:hypothetical protein
VLMSGMRGQVPESWREPFPARLRRSGVDLVSGPMPAARPPGRVAGARSGGREACAEVMAGARIGAYSRRDSVPKTVDDGTGHCDES